MDALDPGPTGQHRYGFMDLTIAVDGAPIAKGSYGEIYTCRVGQKPSILKISTESSSSLDSDEILKDDWTELLIHTNLFCLLRLGEAHARLQKTLGRRSYLPRIPKILAAGQVTGTNQRAIAMEKVEMDLEDVAGATWMTRGGILDCVRQVVSLVDALQHLCQFMHRDLKSNNIMVNRIGTSSRCKVMLIDFGMARCLMRLGKTQEVLLNGNETFFSSEGQYGNGIRGHGYDRSTDMLIFFVDMYYYWAQKTAFRGSKLQTYVQSKVEMLFSALENYEKSNTAEVKQKLGLIDSQEALEASNGLKYIMKHMKKTSMPKHLLFLMYDCAGLHAEAFYPETILQELAGIKEDS